MIACAGLQDLNGLEEAFLVSLLKESYQAILVR